MYRLLVFYLVLSRIALAEQLLDISSLYRHQIFSDHHFQLYATPSAQGVSNQYYHYFIERESEIHYLGEFPQITYDERAQVFRSLEKIGPAQMKQSYRIQDGRLQLLNSSLEQGPLTKFDLASSQRQRGEVKSIIDCPLPQKSEGGGGEYLKQVLTCALYKLYPSSRLHHARMKMLDFIVDRLAKQFQQYGIASIVEKSHFLSQVIHESDTLLSTVERRGGNDIWYQLFVDPSPQWNCPRYLNAMESDQFFFNHQYTHSKNTYRAAFRGRGLIQLTRCDNYLGFLYHKAAQQINDPVLAAKMKTYFTYFDNNGRRKQIKYFCDEDVLEQVSEQYPSLKTLLDSREFSSNFENIANQLSLPCPDAHQGSLSGREFIVDSALWYWKRCQQNYPLSLSQYSGRAVANISKCIHGTSAYDRFDRSSCENMPKSPNWIRSSYCQRLRAFDILHDYFILDEAAPSLTSAE